jgi:hypothetical protein
MSLTFDNLGNLGRLGNQMFQYASLRGIAQNRGYDYFIPNRDIELYQCFNIPRKYGISNQKRVTHKNYEFDYDLYEYCFDDVDLWGFFQSEKYFKSIENEIRKDFTFYGRIHNMCSKYITGTFLNTELISIHIRRGDYLSDSNFCNLHLDYYFEALKLLPDLPILVFSDDINWCESMLSNRKFKFIKSNNHQIDLCLMTMCDYHIIANSSFSWWGSWLAKSKKTIAPSTWFQNEYSHWNTKDLYLPDWTII